MRSIGPQAQGSSSTRQFVSVRMASEVRRGPFQMGMSTSTGRLSEPGSSRLLFGLSVIEGVVVSPVVTSPGPRSWVMA